jgi:AcrR family transcriptional regulator
MTTTRQPRRRPGGRSARVREQVHEAVLELLGEQRWDQVSIPAVAERSGIHAATIYRRWGGVADLADEVVAERLGGSAPIPDTGTLRGDLEVAAVRFAEAIAGPLGRILLRAAALSGPTADAPVALHTRAEQLQEMLDRAAARGEKTPTLVELLEGVTAPLYFHALFFGRPADAAHARELVHRLLVFVEAR